MNNETVHRAYIFSKFLTIYRWAVCVFLFARPRARSTQLTTSPIIFSSLLLLAMRSGLFGRAK